jgi:4-hydroxyphenylpyruvate dioxygenase
MESWRKIVKAMAWEGQVEVVPVTRKPVKQVFKDSEVVEISARL